MGTDVEAAKKTIAAVVSRDRKASGLSLRELGANVELSPSYISLVERAVSGSLITKATLQRLESALGVDWSALYTQGDAEGWWTPAAKSSLPIGGGDQNYLSNEDWALFVSLVDSHLRTLVEQREADPGGCATNDLKRCLLWLVDVGRYGGEAPALASRDREDLLSGRLSAKDWLPQKALGNAEQLRLITAFAAYLDPRALRDNFNSFGYSMARKRLYQIAEVGI